MRSLTWLVMAGAVFAGGCSENTDDGGEVPANKGFLMPTVTTTASQDVEGQWVDQGPADWSCLNTSGDDVATTVEVALSGQVKDFQAETPVPGAEVTAFSGTDLTAVIGDGAVVADSEGMYALTLPIGETRIGFQITAPETMDTYQLNYIFEPNKVEQTHDVNSVSELTANALPAFIGVTRTPDLGVLAGSVRDCQGREVSGAVATVSSLAGSAEHMGGAQSYYFSAGTTSLPVRHSQQPFTNTDSLFVVIELPPGQGFLQTWGFVSEQHLADRELTLLSEIQMPIKGNSMITAAMEPLRTE